MISILSVGPTEKVTLIKQDGQKINEIKACVQKTKIFIDDANIPIEDDDKIIRYLPNGLTETYIVLDKGFKQRTHGIEAHYQASVIKESAYEKEQTKSEATTIINNIGQYSKANINSTDNSINTYNSETNVFNKLREIAHTLPNESQHIIIENIDEMEESCGKNNFKENYNKFIQIAANHMTLFAPFIPMLTEMLTK